MTQRERKPENTLDFYNEKLTKKAVGRLFREYMEEGEKNYFIDEGGLGYDSYDNSQGTPQDNSYGDISYDEDVPSNIPRRNSGNGPTEESKVYDGHYENFDSNDSAYIPSQEGDVGQQDYYNGAQQDYYDNRRQNYAYADQRSYTDGIQQDDADYDKEYGYDTVKVYRPRRKRVSRDRPSSAKNHKKSGKSTKNSRGYAKTHQKKYKNPNAEDEYYEDGYRSRPSGTPFKALTFLFAFLSVFLAAAAIVEHSKLSDKTAELEHMSERLNAISNSNESSAQNEKLEALRNENGAFSGGLSNINKQNNTVDDTKTTSDASAASDAGASNAGASDASTSDTDSAAGGSTYIVKKGDNAWKISMQFYGTGDYYLEILEENGLSADSSLTVGMELKIPQH